MATERAPDGANYEASEEKSVGLSEKVLSRIGQKACNSRIENCENEIFA